MADNIEMLFFVTGLVLVIISAVIWFEFSYVKASHEIPYIGVGDNVVAGILELVIGVFVTSIIIIWRPFAEKERLRADSDPALHEVTQSRTVVFPNVTELIVDMTCCGTESDHYKMPSVVASLLEWTEFDKKEFYRIAAGSIDIPKIALSAMTIDDSGARSRLSLKIGTASYFDTFYTHYCPDLSLSSYQLAEKPVNQTLRNILGPGLDKFYDSQISGNHLSVRDLHCASWLPNPLGLSGIVIISEGEQDYVLLSWRREHEIAARHRLEWAFAGLVEATGWLGCKNVSLKDFVEVELRDEICSEFSILAALEPRIYPIGLVLNPKYLYQPELFVVVHYELASVAALSAQVEKPSSRFMLPLLSQLDGVLNENSVRLKNLCKPGLYLLKLAWPQIKKATADRAKVPA